MKIKTSSALLLASVLICGCVAMSSCSASTGNKVQDSKADDQADSRVEEKTESADSDVLDETALDTAAPDVSEDSVSAPDDETELIYYDDPIPDTAIENERFEFKYFEEWSEHIRFETKDADGRYEILCYGVGDIEGIHCFSIVFADCEGQDDHYFIGELNGTPVYTYVNQNFAELSDDQIDLINNTVLTYYMNDLTYQLKDAEGFVSRR